MTMNADFKRFALAYLDLWLSTDQRIFNEMNRNNTPQVREVAIKYAAAEYNISRGFKGIQEIGWGVVLQLLDATPFEREKVDPDEVSAAVICLAGRFREKFGRQLQSAASKLLWFLHQSPIVIFDSRAQATLENLTQCGKLDNYVEFLRSWRDEYQRHRDAIAAACCELIHIKEWTRAADMHDGQLAALAATEWFQERVFDMYLFDNGQ